MLELAGKCDGKTADIHTSELRDVSVSTDWHSLLTDNHVGFPLGAVIKRPRGKFVKAVMVLWCGERGNSHLLHFSGWSM